jgi:hypothetical protein
MDEPKTLLYEPIKSVLVLSRGHSMVRFPSLARALLPESSKLSIFRTAFESLMNSIHVLSDYATISF